MTPLLTRLRLAIHPPLRLATAVPALSSSSSCSPAVTTRSSQKTQGAPSLARTCSSRLHSANTVAVAPIPLSSGRAMASLAAQPAQNTPFTRAVVQALRSLYPEEVADRAWDNVGLLLGNFDSPSQRQLGLESTPDHKTVLLTNDLSPAVAQEAVEKKASLIVSYHPFIFRGLKSVDLVDPQQRILLQLAQKNIAVYCPHTAVDAVPGGLNDWLVDVICGSEQPQSRSAVQPTSAPPPAGFEGAGYGRRAEFAQPVAVGDLVRRLAAGLGGLKHVMVAAPRHFDASTATVQSAAVCAGSGWDVLKSCPVDVLVTGEMSHHNALRATMEGKVVITVFHSNSERAYLRQRMQPALEAQLRKTGTEARILVSDEDKDPFEVWDVERLGAGPAS